MANEIKGEFTLDVGDEQYRLLLDINALCEAEGMLSMKSSEIAAAIGNGDMRLLRTLLYAATREHHKGLTVSDCGDLITEASPNKIAATLILGINAAFPAPKAPDADARPTRRRTARETAAA